MAANLRACDVHLLVQHVSSLLSRRDQPVRVDDSETRLLGQSTRLVVALPVDTSSVEHENPRFNVAIAAPACIAPEEGKFFSAAYTNRLLRLYYSQFHRSYSMLIPRAYFSAQNYPDHLPAAVCLVCHHFH